MERRWKVKILVAEDDTFLRKSVVRFIQQSGYEALEAVNGREALEIFRNENPSLVLTDLRMPVMSGFELMEELAEESPQTPVIVFSGIGQKPDIEKALRTGAVDYISKPVEDVEFLIDRIEKALLKTNSSPGQKGTGPESSGEITHTAAEKQESRTPVPQTAGTGAIEWQAALDALDSPLAVLDRNHRIVRLNKAMGKVLGTEPSEAIGTTRFVSTNGLDNEQQACADLDRVLNQQPVAGRFYDSGQQAYYDAKMAPCQDPATKTIDGFVYMLRDMAGA